LTSRHAARRIRQSETIRKEPMIRILDSTLREGEQTPGVYFDVHIKLAIADLLDEIGIEIIEAGHPAVTPNICSAVRQISGRGLKALVGAHSRSLESDVELALECGVKFLGIFYCVSDERLSDRATDLAQAIAQITRTVRFAKEKSPSVLVRYTPEDTVRSSFDNVLAAASEAVGAGADIISIADTTGFMIPGTRNMYDYVQKLKAGLARNGLTPLIAVHCHNDRGLALANALDGYRAGADIIDASILGLGERAGIVDLATLLAILSHDFGEGKQWNLRKIPRLYELVSNYSRIPIPPTFPLTGANAFTHCAGVHTQAALRNPVHYQSMPPGVLGRTTQISLDHMSGMAAVQHCLSSIDEEDLPHDTVQRILSKVKEVGETGRTVSLQELSYIARYVKDYAEAK
jgi:2-isopropylmalate synthase